MEKNMIDVYADYSSSGLWHADTGVMCDVSGWYDYTQIHADGTKEDKHEYIPGLNLPADLRERLRQWIRWFGESDPDLLENGSLVYFADAAERRRFDEEGEAITRELQRVHPHYQFTYRSIIRPFAAL